VNILLSSSVHPFPWYQYYHHTNQEPEEFHGDFVLTLCLKYMNCMAVQHLSSQP
jgi:hypothetical protein